MAADKEKKPKAKKRDPSAEFFADTAVPTFHITIEKGPLAALNKDNRAYVRATVTEGTNVFKDVGLHLKGMGSFRPLNEKPSFAVKFDKYTPNQEYRGLSKFMLNNSSQDGTYLAEYVATSLFRDGGVPAARVTHARVTLNGRDLGLYVLLEAMNKHFLERWFKSAKGNLYEVYLTDIDHEMELDGSDGADRTQTDRKALVAATQMQDPAQRWSRLQAVLDVDRFISFTALEMLASHTDGYAMNRNNYRIYRDVGTERFTFIAHGMDWGLANPGVGLVPPMNSLVVKAVLQTPEGRRQYRERLGELFTNVFRVDVLTNRVHAAVAKLKAAARTPGEAKEFENYGVEMRQRIVNRAQFVADRIAEPEPLPLKFDAAGVARVAGWRVQKDSGEPSLDQPKVEDKPTLHINADAGGGIASWRTRVLLAPGKYRFQGRARAAHVAPQNSEVGVGAGIRISGDKRSNKLTGDAGWQMLEHDFEVQGGDTEIELVCELRAAKGETWFDVESLRLARK